jgi:uncharacterized protein YceK
MRNIFTSLFIILLLAGCSSSTKLLQKGEYDAAIDKSIKKLLKDADNPKEINILDRAYKLANERDRNVIEELKLSGQPDVWEDAFRRYSNLRNRQDRVSRLPRKVLSKINYEHIDYNREIAEAKNKAANYYYASGVKLLENNDRMSARKAYEQFGFIRKYFRNYKDVDQKMQQALDMGTNHVIFKIQNEARVALPDDFEEEILKISLSSLNKQWLEFDSHYDENMFYDYSIFLNLKHIEVSPQSLEKEKYTDSKRVSDGWEYVLDGNGNVMKDSLGNDIKKGKFKEIKAYVTVNKMNKRSIVTGSLNYYDNRSRQLIKTVPIRSEFVFDYQYGVFAGEKDALTSKSLAIIKNKPAPFPNDLQMIFDTSDQIKKISYETVKRDVRMFLN